MRLNSAIAKLEAGDILFGSIPADDERELAAIAASRYDLMIIETEHTGFDARALRGTLQGLLDRRQLVERATLAPAVTPLVRTPANAREHDEWMIKQTLDAGAYGIVLPHLDSVESALAAVRAARYPQRLDAANPEPSGQRGWAGSMCPAPSYWGLPAAEYYEKADLWPLNPDGEILLMGICESIEGIEALPDILREVKGVGAIWAGIGDLSVSMGYGGAYTAEVELEMQHIAAICREAGVPCAAAVTPDVGPEQRIEQGFRIILSRPRYSFDTLNRGLAYAARA